MKMQITKLHTVIMAGLLFLLLALAPQQWAQRWTKQFHANAQQDQSSTAAPTAISGLSVAAPLMLMPGDLDTSFNVTGKVTNLVGSDGAARSVKIQPDGKIVVGGYSQAGGNPRDFTLIRYNVDGSLDTSFDGDGIVVTAMANEDLGISLALQPDGKIVVGGGALTPGSGLNFAAYRYNTDGSLDTSFDGDGKAVVSIRNADDLAFGIAVQSDGKIVLAGESQDPSNSSKHDWALVRLNANGSLDTSFDSDGVVLLIMATIEYHQITGLALQSDGKIIAAGRIHTGITFDFSVMRFNSNGSLDSTFSGDGIQTTHLTSYDEIIAVAVQSDGKIVVTGFVTGTGGYDFGVVRYNSDGSLDTSFDGDGKVVTDMQTGNDQANGLAIQDDGKIIVAGQSSANFGVARYLTNGALDTTWGTGGKVNFDMGGTDIAYSVAIQANRRVVVAGGSGNSFAVARLFEIGPPTIHKAFSLPAIQAGNPVTVTLTLSNSNPDALTNASFTDTLMGGLYTVGGPVTGTCSGTMPTGLAPGLTSLSFSGMTIPANGSCQVSFTVSGATAGTINNTTSGVTTTQTPVAGPVSNTATLTVYGAPTVAKTFSPSTIISGGTSTVTLTLTNPNSQGVIAFLSDTLINMNAIGGPGSIAGSCALFNSATIPVNAVTVDFSGGLILPASGSCTVSFQVRSNTVGTHPNITSGVTTNLTPTPGAPSNTATLTVMPNIPPTINKTMTTLYGTPGSTTIALGSVGQVTLTLSNANPVGVLANWTDTLVGFAAVGGPAYGTCATTGGVSFSPGQTNLSFSGVVLPPNGSCTVTFLVTGTAAGTQSNTTSGVVTDRTPTAGPPSNTSTLSVVPTTVNKTFSPTEIFPGQMSTVTLTLNNTAPEVVLASLSDTLTNMTAVAGTAGGTCGRLNSINITNGATNVNLPGLIVPASGSCTVTFKVTSNVFGVWPNTTSGVTVNNSGFPGPVSNTATLTVLDPNAQIVAEKVTKKPVRYDFDGDRISDHARYDGTTGAWLVQRSSDGELQRIALVAADDKAEYLPVAADFDGDGKYDGAVWRPSDGQWLIKQSSDGEFVKTQFGLAEDTPMAGDFDGDGKADLALYRNVEGGLHVLRSRDNTSQAIYLGQAGDMPVLGDFDGDRLTDFAVFRKGHWLVRLTATGQISDVQFGQAGDEPLAADLDGDGKDEPLVWRAAEGVAYARGSNDQNVLPLSLGKLQPGEMTVFGDYDGDGRDDVGIWRVAKAAWEVLFNKAVR